MKEKVADLDDADLLSELTARLARSAKPPMHWIDVFASGEKLRVDECASVADVSTETVRRWCIEADESGEPISPSPLFSPKLR